MTRKNLTDITVVLDRSGSMQSCADDAIGGLNAFIKEQKELKGDALFTLIKFDHEYLVACDGIDIKSVEECGLEPRGSTALLDALGRAITTTGRRLKALDEKDRPSLVIICVITDGHENSSHEYSRSQIKDMIKTQTEVFDWQFTFLAADQDAFAEGGAMGFAHESILNYSGVNTTQVFNSMSRNVKTMRGQKAGGQMVSCSYTAEEREDAVAKS